MDSLENNSLKEATDFYALKQQTISQRAGSAWWQSLRLRVRTT